MGMGHGEQELSMLLIICLIVAGLCTWGCATIAKTKGRDTTLWGFLGFFFGVFALGVLLCLSDQRDGQQPDLRDVF